MTLVFRCIFDSDGRGWELQTEPRPSLQKPSQKPAASQTHMKSK